MGGVMIVGFLDLEGDLFFDMIILEKDCWTSKEDYVVERLCHWTRLLDKNIVLIKGWRPGSLYP